MLYIVKKAKHHEDIEILSLRLSRIKLITWIDAILYFLLFITLTSSWLALSL